MPGPFPKREDERFGHTHEAAGVKPINKIVHETKLRPPRANPEWLPIAKAAYKAFVDSPLNEFYAQTDLIYGWMAAQAIHEAVLHPTATRTLAAESMMRSAMFNEGDRRRVRIEITRKEPETNPVTESNVSDFMSRRRSS